MEENEGIPEGAGVSRGRRDMYCREPSQTQSQCWCGSKNMLLSEGKLEGSLESYLHHMLTRL